jgi:molybdopterin molybdotransferase
VARDLIDLDDARRIVIDSCAPLPSESVAIARALGRALAEQIRSDVSIPPFDNATMDGFAVRSEDTLAARPGSPARLGVVGESRAGRPAGRTLGPEQAIRISTGAVLPAGADAVLRQEEAVERDGVIETQARVDPGRDIRRTGEDIEPGQTVLASGHAIGPAELGVLASIGRDPVPCRRRPRLALVGTGDELVDPAGDLRAGQIRDTNGIALAALAERAGAELTFARRVGDDAGAIRAALAHALHGDVTVITGGVSVGPHDHVRPALEELGAEQLFWGVALRPGRPTWFGLTDGGPKQGGALVFGLPGNPVSAVVTFLLFVRPALLALAGLDPWRRRVRATLDESYEKRTGRAHALRVSLELESDGWHARPTRPEQASHILTSMLGADALAFVPADSTGVPAGGSVEVEPI